MATLVATVLATGPAHAAPAYDPNSTAPWSGPAGDRSASAFWTDVRRMTDLGGDVDDAKALAQTVCAELEHGANDGDVIVGMANDNQRLVGGMTLVVHGAEWHYCPDKY